MILWRGKVLWSFLGFQRIRNGYVDDVSFLGVNFYRRAYGHRVNEYTLFGLTWEIER